MDTKGAVEERANLLEDETAEDDGVFEIGDFTAVTPMEQFITNIEVSLQDWDVSGIKPLHTYKKGSLKKVEWAQKTKVVKLTESNNLCMTYYYPVIEDENTRVELKPGEDKAFWSQTCHDMMSPELDLVPQCNIATMFGVSEFLLFSPLNPKDDNINNEGDMEFIRSSLMCAAQSIECSIPMFLQYGNIERQLFFGVSVSTDTTTQFDGSHIRRGQSQHQNLSGLIALFKNHCKSPTSINLPEIRLSIQQIISLDNLPEIGIISVDTISVPFRLDKFAVGSQRSPLTSLFLLASWPNHSDEVVIENNLYSDLDPLNACEWSMCLDFENFRGELSLALEKFLNVKDQKFARKTATDVLGLDDFSDQPLAFRQLADPGVKNLQFGTSSGEKSSVRSEYMLLPMEENNMSYWINAIFRSVDSLDMKRTGNGDADKLITELENTVGSVKYHSLCAKLAKAFYHLSINDFHSKNSHVQLWHAFVQKLRNKYENQTSICEDDHIKEPNLNSSFLNQKIEMLQCCINARNMRHKQFNEITSFGGGTDDDFFDAEEEISESDPVKEEVKKEDKKEENLETNGRLNQHENLFLHGHKDVALYNFVVQEPCPMTEDMLDAHQTYLESLNEKERQQAQLATLISDMQGFKAANPLGEFVDFVRWHSPKDWIEEEGQLSERFQIEDNVWMRCWNESRPVPAVNQVRIFNETKIAEEILSQLQDASIEKVVEWLLPILFTGAATQLLLSCHAICSKEDMEVLVKSVTKAVRSKNRDDYLDALREIKKMERYLMHFESIRLVLMSAELPVDNSTEFPSNDELFPFIKDLIDNWRNKQNAVNIEIVPKGVSVPGGVKSSFGRIIRALFVRKDEKGNDCMAIPDAKQYVLRWIIPRPYDGSRRVPQRLFASLEREEFRLAASYTDDNIFY